MARVLILGGGFGGVATAVTLQELLAGDVEITLVSQRPYFMVGFRKTWAMLEMASLDDGLRSLTLLEKRGIKVVLGTVEAIDPATRSAIIDGQRVEADALVVALGVRHAPEKIPGFKEHALNAYTVEELERVTQALRDFKGGQVVTGVFGLPYQCPPAPYEIAMLTKEYFQRRRVDMEITVISPKPLSLWAAGKELSDRLDQRMAEFGIKFLPNRVVTAVEAGAVVCGETRMPCDMALGVPPHIAVDVVRNSPLAAAGGWVHVNRQTLETAFEDVYAVGDCVKIPVGTNGRIPLAGLFAEKEGIVVARRIAARLREEQATAVLDGEAGCYVEAGRQEAAVIGGDFLADPAPDIALSEFSRAHFDDKHEFERSRLEAWFG
jgi:sulfide:quinone oxidoreductase